MRQNNKRVDIRQNKSTRHSSESQINKQNPILVNEEEQKKH